MSQHSLCRDILSFFYPLFCCDNHCLSWHISSVSLGVLLSFCHNIVPIVTTILLLFALSFVATILSLSRQFALPILAKSAVFLTLFMLLLYTHAKHKSG